LAIFFVAVVLFWCKKQEVELQSNAINDKVLDDKAIEQKIVAFKL